VVADLVSEVADADEHGKVSDDERGDYGFHVWCCVLLE
jgi:hypothetical protein